MSNFMPGPGSGSPQSPSISELLKRRGELQEWLTRLESVDNGSDARVVARIRSDYEERLRAVTQELAGQVESIRHEQTTLEQALRSAERRLREAQEQLAEAQLRHRIGELSADRWNKQRSDLEDTVAEMTRMRDAARAEVQRMQELLAQFDDAQPAAPPATPPQPAAPAARSPEPAPAAPPPAPPQPPAPDPAAAEGLIIQPVGAESLNPEPLPELQPTDGADDGAGQDVGFLQELEQAISGSREVAADPDATVESPGGAARSRGLKCSDCGYTNDAEAWYCGVCGAELA